MLQRPKIFSCEDIRLFVGSKNPAEKYAWPDGEICARAQYLMARGYPARCDHINEPAVSQLNNIAHKLWRLNKNTFGELYNELCRCSTISTMEMNGHAATSV